MHDDKIVAAYGDFLTDALRSSVRSIEIETVFGKTTLDDPFNPKAPEGIGAMVAAWTRPKITVRTIGDEKLAVAPYGDPASLRPFVETITVILIGVGVFATTTWIAKKLRG